ncbi:MAG: SpoIIE family protein phosphatase [Lachnospiraceae bacterium]|nr:SpoIIE family protein phosphatase [Lachnospiraceae bacterium]
MKVSKLFGGIGFFLVAISVGLSFVWDINAFSVGFLVAACLAGESMPVTAIGLLVGIALTASAFNVIKYSIIFMLLMVLLGLKNSINLRGRDYLIALLAGLITGLVDISVYLIYPDKIDVLMILSECVLVFSTSVIYYKCINGFKEDYMKLVVESETLLSALALGATMLWGLPVSVGGLVIAESFAIFSMLYADYKFGLGVGLSWTVIAGAVISKKLGDTSFLLAWLIISIAVYSINSIINGNRIIFSLVYILVYYAAGLSYFDVLIVDDGNKAVLSALLVFVFAPNVMMIRVDSGAVTDELSNNSPEWARLIIGRINNLALAFKRIEYTFAGETGSGIGFNDVGEIIENFTNQLDNTVQLKKTIEAKIIEELSSRDIQVKNLILVKNQDERYEVYLNARVRRGRLIAADTVRKLIENEMKIPFELKEESRMIVSKNYEIICMNEKPDYRCFTAVRRLSMYEDSVSGDNFYIGDIKSGQKLIVIADGMGNGEKAAKDSNQLIESLEELLSAGFDKDMSIRVVNSYLADKNRGESFSTLDMLILDLYTGCGRIYKQGAATTFIKRGDWIELIKSTSLPVGVVEGAVCEKCIKKFYSGEFIIMVSDGLLESIIFENKEDYMKELILNSKEDEPSELADAILDNIRSLSGNRMKDDATIIVCKIVKSL